MADPEWQGLPEDEENDEEEAEYEQMWRGRDMLIFLIDCSKAMFVKSEDKESPIETTLKNVVKNKIVSSDKDSIGIVLFGTESLKNPNDFKHIYILQELVHPGAEQVLLLQSLLTDLSDCNSTFGTKYGHSNDFSLSDGLWVCSFMFLNSAGRVGSKRILLFTNDDNPHEGNVQLQTLAKQKAKDLFETGIEIDILSLSPEAKNEAFDLQKFYSDIIMLPEDEDPSQVNPSEKLEELLARVRTKDHKKRITSRVNWKLPGGTSLAVAVYMLVRPLRVPYQSRLNKATHEELRTISKTYLKDTAELLLPSDIQKYQEYGGRKLYFEPDEVVQIKRFAEPGLYLLGFKPVTSLKPHYYTKPACFLYPDENRIRGSTQLFTALLMKCSERRVVAICSFVPRNNTPPRLVALLPQYPYSHMEEEVIGDSGIQEAPPGFHVIYLPFSEDMRSLDVKSYAKANEDQVEKAKDIIKKLQFRFHSENFENPVIQKHWSNVEALALDLNEPEPVTDYTIPDHDAMEKRSGKLIQEFKRLISYEGYDAFTSAGSKKRGTSHGSKSEEKIADIDISNEAKQGKLEKYTVDVLKSFCQKHGIKFAGKKKSELIKDIKDYVNKD